MRVLFKHPRKLGAVTYHKGTNTVPDEFAGHWFFLALVQNGTASIVSDAPMAEAAAEPPFEAALPPERDKSKKSKGKPGKSVKDPESAG